jgi:hypothetical protein
VLVENGAIDLKTGRRTGWPPGVIVGAVAATADERLVIVAKQHGKLELVILHKNSKLERAPIELAGTTTLRPSAVPVGVVADRAGRVVIAFDDGTLLVREAPATRPAASQAAPPPASPAAPPWSVVRISADLPGPKPGSPPAVSP